MDLEQACITIMVRKTRRMLELPLKDAALAVVKGWHGLRKCKYVFYNPETGEQWKDLWVGLKKACRMAGISDVTWHTFRHTRIAAHEERRGSGDREGTAGPLLDFGDNAVCAHQSRRAKVGGESDWFGAKSASVTLWYKPGV